MTVSAVIVTRGDVELQPIIESLPRDWEIIVWTNGDQVKRVWADPPGSFGVLAEAPDLAVYGRYAAIEYAKGDVIYVQDDDALHTTEGIQRIVDEWLQPTPTLVAGGEYVIYHSAFNEPFAQGVVCNMPANFRHSFYQEHALVGFGAAFHRDLPARAFDRLWQWQVARGKERGIDLESMVADRSSELGKALKLAHDPAHWPMNFLRTCDIVFTALTPRILVDVPYEDMPWASAPNRMWKQESHRSERAEMLELVLKVRDA